MGGFVVSEKFKRRRRYIAFRIVSEQAVSRRELIGAINRKARKDEKGSWQDDRPWLIKLDKNLGIIRCAHTNKDTAIKLLNSIDRVGNNTPIKVITLGTSGTIKGVKRNFHQPFN
jgi:RNase P/RNase MRP subunit POP5